MNYLLQQVDVVRQIKINRRKMAANESLEQQMRGL